MDPIETNKSNAGLDALLTQIRGGDVEATRQFADAIKPWLDGRIEAQAEGRGLPVSQVAEAAHDRFVDMVSDKEQSWQGLSRQFVASLDAACGALERQKREARSPDVGEVQQHETAPSAHDDFMEEGVRETLTVLTPMQLHVLSGRLAGKTLEEFHSTREATRKSQAAAARKVSEAAEDMFGEDKWVIRKRIDQHIQEARKKHGDKPRS